MHSNFFLFSLSSSQKFLFPIWNYIIHFYHFFSKTGIIFFCFWESKNCLAHIVIHHTLQLCIWLEVCMSENYCSTFDFLLLHTMKSEFKWELKRCKYSWLARVVEKLIYFLLCLPHHLTDCLRVFKPYVMHYVMEIFPLQLLVSDIPKIIFDPRFL